MAETDDVKADQADGGRFRFECRPPPQPSPRAIAIAIAIAIINTRMCENCDDL